MTWYKLVSCNYDSYIYLACFMVIGLGTNDSILTSYEVWILL
jgi:hypothetical protein